MTRKIFTAIALSAAALSTTLIATPAAAQGTDGPITRHEGKGSCPSGWNVGKGKNQSESLCYKGSSGSPAYYNPQRKSCAPGYYSPNGTNNGVYCWELSGEQADQRSAADKLVSNATLVKANRLDRCPLGYFSKSDMTTCTTWLTPAPTSRRKAGACRANEIDEWGLYCTANANVITRQQAEDEANRDFNAIYSENGATSPRQDGGETTNSAPMIAAYGPKGSGGSAAQASSGNSTTASAPAASTNCQTESSNSGAILGGAIGGDTGAAIGSMLGGFGKKKKKSGC